MGDSSTDVVGRGSASSDGELVEDAGSSGSLEVSGFAVSIGRREIVHDVSFATRPGHITAVVGHNGAGKTTLLSGLLGLLPSHGGRVVLDGHDISGTATATRARRGLALVPDRARGVFSDMTVAENLGLSTICSRVARGEDRIRSMDGLAERLFPAVVVGRRHQLAGSLSGGERQMLAIAAALTRRPSVLLLDEPSLGLAPVLVERVLMGVREAVSACSIACLLVEQNVGAAMKVVDSLVVLKEGAVVASFDAPALPSVQALWELF